MIEPLLAVVLPLLALIAADVGVSKPTFDPYIYNQKSASCPAVDRSVSPPLAKTIDLKYVDIKPISAKKTLLMVHGWPSLWSTWSNQILEFSDEYRLIVPDLRGFGSSGHPGDPQSSSHMEDFVSDFICMLDDAGIDEAVCVGHDWGAEACWEAGRQRPDRITAIAGAVVPYMPSNSDQLMPMSAMVQYLPRLTYQIYFANHTEAAAKELDADLRRSLRATFRSVTSPPPAAFLTSTESYLDAYSGVDIPPIPFMTPTEEDYLVSSYKIQGFKNTLQFYTNGNRYGSWLFSHTQGNYTLPQPTLWIAPTEDPVANWLEVDGILHSDEFLSNHTTKTMTSAHWPQLEQKDEYNQILRTWLEGLVGAVEVMTEASNVPHRGEL